MISLRAEKCIGCGVCYLVCPKGVFEMSEVKGPLKIRCWVSGIKNPEKCDSCGKCVRECPAKALFLE